MNIRKATLNDIPAIEALMKHSMLHLGEGFYSKEQIASCCQFVCVPDTQLIEDNTFFVVEDHNHELIGCGGWSYRNKLYAGPEKENIGLAESLDPKTDPCKIRAMFTHPKHVGRGVGSLVLETALQEAKEHSFTTASLGSTLSGYPFYQAKGWQEIKREEAILPDKVQIGVIHMNFSLTE